MKLPVEESEFIPCDILDIVRYVRLRNPAAANRFIEAFQETVERLSRMPEIGKSRPDLDVPETRSFRVSGFRNYLIFYDVHPDHLRILRVLHGYRDLQAELSK